MAKRTRLLAHLRRVFILLFILLAFSFDSSLANELSNKECNRSPLSTPIVSLAALYRQDIESSYLKSICEALKKHKLGSTVTVHKFPYGNEDTAFEILRNLLKDKNINMVLGPTDSGVFLRAIRELGDTTTAIISPLVTAKYTFNPKKLIFSTNVSIKKRTRTMAHTLAKYGLRSLVVLHSDSKFGQETEAAFREVYLQQKPESQYRPLQYNSQNFADDGPDLQIKQVLLDRPEGLGLFGTRAEIQEISKLLKEMNVSLTPLSPNHLQPYRFPPPAFRRLHVTYSFLEGRTAT